MGLRDREGHGHRPRVCLSGAGTFRADVRIGGRLSLRLAAGLVPAKISFRGCQVCSLNGGLCMTLTLRDARRDPIANRALGELSRRYNVVEESSGLVLTQKTGNMKLFLNNLDDLHQWDFVRNQKLRESLRKLGEQRESWKHRALVAEATLVEVAANAANSDRGQNVSDLRYATLKRYLAKQLHPDHAPGNGIEKNVRNEIFKEIWGEIDRMSRLSGSESSTAGPEARSRQSA
jgi:hypothetical protein